MSKEFGVFYTPKFLIDFIIDKISLNIPNGDEISIIEPSAGDGRFIDEFIGKIKDETLNATLVEINKESADLLNKKYAKNKKIKIIHSDFLYYENAHKFDIVLGNPPYISKKHLTKDQISRCREILLSASIPSLADKNIWTSFVIRCSDMLKNTGIMALVLPFDLLQVKFSSYIQSYLIDNFSRIEIYTPNKLAFDKIEQDTIILLAYKKSQNKGLYINNLLLGENNTDKSKLLYKSTSECRGLISKNENIKWSSLTLSDHELNFLAKLSDKLKNIGDYAKTRPGIVTAANSFFILPHKKIEEYSLREHATPILQKSQFFQKKITFSKTDFDKLVESEKPTYFIDLLNYEKNSSPQIENYLALGEAHKIDKRYKCLRRKKWYVVPKVPPGDGFFFKRCNGYPKLHKNEFGILTTDAAYNLEVNAGFNINSLIYSFYNPLTLCFAELYGRYYGGGVLELVPNEFRKLPIPYKKVSLKTFSKFKAQFENKESIDEILFSSGRDVLSGIVDDVEFNIILNIYKKLIQRRLKN